VLPSLESLPRFGVGLGVGFKEKGERRKEKGEKQKAENLISINRF
jgi:hypothetical protein